MQAEQQLSHLSGAQSIIERSTAAEGAQRAAEAVAAALHYRLDATQAELAVAQQELVTTRARAAAAEEAAASQRQQTGSSTPRPSRDLGPLSDLLSSQEAAMVQAALVAGVPAPIVHQLLLGVMASGQDAMPWLGLLGCCRSMLEAAGLYMLPAVGAVAAYHAKRGRA